MKFRASFTVLSIWASGDYQRAVEAYFKLKPFVTRAMAEGRKYHEQWAGEIRSTGCMPKIFGGTKLTEPQIEVKVCRQLDDWLEFVGVVDLIHGDTMCDWKSGKTPSGDYANSYQARVYQILFPKAKRFEFHHYDPLTKKTDNSIVYLTPQTLRDGLEWIVTQASEFHDYLSENKLYERFSK